MYFENNFVLTTLVLIFKMSFSSASSSMQLSAIIVSVHLWYTTFSNQSKNNMEIKWQQSQEGSHWCRHATVAYTLFTVKLQYTVPYQDSVLKLVTYLLTTPFFVTMTPHCGFSFHFQYSSSTVDLRKFLSYQTITQILLYTTCIAFDAPELRIILNTAVTVGVFELVQTNQQSTYHVVSQ